MLGLTPHGETTRRTGRGLRVPRPQSPSDKCAPALGTPHSGPQQQDDDGVQWWWEGGWAVSDKAGEPWPGPLTGSVTWED